MSNSKPNEEIEVSRVTAEEVKARVDRGEPVLFVDSRSASSWSESDVTIPGSVRVPPDDAAAHIKDVPHGRSIVTFCT
jgi:rhodanese-related sulfurtransferase